jgi:hypothetical protein
MHFKDFPQKSWEELLPGAETPGRNLVADLVKYSDGERLSAENVSRGDSIAMDDTNVINFDSRSHICFLNR